MQRPALRPVLPLSGAALLALARDVLGQGAGLRFRAHGGSMRPFVRDGDTLTVAPMASLPDDPRTGDVFAFERAGRVVAHRVIRAGEAGFLFKGDCLAQPDGWFPRAALLGRVVRVERAGRLVRFGLGPERAAIAVLSRLGAISGLAALKRIVFR
jgi:hypothetical protein